MWLWTSQVLERVVHRWEYQKNEEERKKAAQAEADAEKIAFQTLDWHDFVVRKWCVAGMN